MVRRPVWVAMRLLPRGNGRGGRADAEGWGHSLTWGPENLGKEMAGHRPLEHREWRDGLPLRSA